MTIGTRVRQTNFFMKCPICSLAFRADDICATDIELGTCHSTCLEGSPIVDLETGEPSEGPVTTFRYGDD